MYVRDDPGIGTLKDEMRLRMGSMAGQASQIIILISDKERSAAKLRGCSGPGDVARAKWAAVATQPQP